MSENILSVQNLHTSFHTDKGEVKAVNGVTFNLEKGKILGIVGESGSGKSVTAYSIMRILEKNGRITEGKILYKGQDIAEFSEKQMREFRGKCCSIIFQDPMTSLNPVFTVGNQLREAIELHTDRKGKEEMCIRDSVLFAAFFAILFAVQGFCWLYSRRKTDLYFSVPESLKKRYMLICGNGILVYSFSTLTALLLDWIIGAAFHGMTGILAAQSLLAWFVEQLAFIAMYQVALVAVMLTGNILTALLGCAVFFSYELAVRFLIDELKTMFFASYCSADARPVSYTHLEPARFDSKAREGQAVLRGYHVLQCVRFPGR